MLSHLVGALREVQDVEALFATGSTATNSADEFSDIDLLALTRGDVSAVVDQIIDLKPRGTAPTVLQNKLMFGSLQVLNFLTADWSRYDITVAPVQSAKDYTTSTTRLLFQRTDVASHLSPPRAPKEPSPAVIENLTKEFMRVLGLITVGIGREDWVVLASGAGLLRDMTIRLFSEEIFLEDRGGALHLRRNLSPEAYEILASMPAIQASRESCFTSHEAIAQIFIPKARELASESGASWPHELESALREHLKSHGIAYP